MTDVSFLYPAPIAVNPHNETAIRDRGTMLDDMLRDNLDLVICGTAASSKSAEVGHYYAGPGNKFWRTLAQTGLTDRELTPARYRELLDQGIGLTDVVKGQAGNDAEIEFGRAAPDAVRAKILEHEPRYFCFNGKRAAKQFFGVKTVSYGVQPSPLGRTVLFVAPSTSGAANGAWDFAVWQELARLVRQPSRVR